ncbi:hypothetical protein NECID01_1383 [Nematocida sp. AWRm77]|nr:hypothetical protein NECID01_1383 [Nematocida sp. AWRm77]
MESFSYNSKTKSTGLNRDQANVYGEDTSIESTLCNSNAIDELDDIIYKLMKDIKEDNNTRSTENYHQPSSTGTDNLVEEELSLSCLPPPPPPIRYNQPFSTRTDKLVGTQSLSRRPPPPVPIRYNQPSSTSSYTNIQTFPQGFNTAQGKSRYEHEHLEAPSGVQHFFDKNESEVMFQKFKEQHSPHREIQQRKEEGEEEEEEEIELVSMIGSAEDPRIYDSTTVCVAGDKKKNSEDIYCNYKQSCVSDSFFVRSCIVDMYFKLARICIMLPLFIGQFLALTLMMGDFKHIQSTSIIQVFYITFINVIWLVLGCQAIVYVYSITTHLKKYRKLTSIERTKKLTGMIGYWFIMCVTSFLLLLGSALLGQNISYLLYGFIKPIVSVDPSYYTVSDWRFFLYKDPFKIDDTATKLHYTSLAVVATGYVGVVLGYFHCLVFKKHADRSKIFRFVYIFPVFLSMMGCFICFIMEGWFIFNYYKNYNYNGVLKYANEYLPYLWELVSSLGFCLLNIAGFLVFYGVFRINPNINFHDTRYRKKAVISYILLSIVVGSLIYLMASSLMMYFSFRYQKLEKEEYGSSFSIWLKTSIIDRIGNLINTYLLNNGTVNDIVPLSNMTNYTVNGTAPITSITNGTAPDTRMTNDTVVAA